MEIKDITAILPNQIFREKTANLLHQFAGEKPTSSSIVSRFYQDLEKEVGRNPDPPTLEAIEFHPFFYETAITKEDLGKIQWYFRDSSSHISYHLTNGGKDRSLLAVARRYLAKEYPQDIEKWKQKEIENFLAAYRHHESQPNVILTQRPKGARPDGKIYIIDGVHRLLAMAIYYLEEGSLPPTTPKAYLA